MAVPSARPNHFTRQLSEGETIIWQGQPNVRAYVRHHLLMARIMLTVALAGICIYLLQLWITPSLTGFVEAVSAFDIPVWLVLRWGLRQEAEGLQYALTSQRVIISVTNDRRTVFQSIPLDRLPVPSCKQFSDGTGSLRFVRMGLLGGTEFAFERIEQAAKVHTLVVDAREETQAACSLPYWRG